jgi:hypothetical protein
MAGGGAPDHRLREVLQAHIALLDNFWRFDATWDVNSMAVRFTGRGYRPVLAAFVGRLWFVNMRTGRKDTTLFRSFMRTNACFTSSRWYFTTTIGMCFAAQCRMRAAALLPISRAIDTSGTYFFLNIAIDFSEMRKPVGVCQP